MFHPQLLRLARHQTMEPVAGIIVRGSTGVFPVPICSCEGKPAWKPSGDERQDVQNSEKTSAVGRDISAHKGTLQWASGRVLWLERNNGPRCRHNMKPGEAGQTRQELLPSLGEPMSLRDSLGVSQSRCKFTLGAVQFKIHLVSQLLVYVLQSRHGHARAYGFAIERMTERKSASGGATFLFIYFCHCQ